MGKQRNKLNAEFWSAPIFIKNLYRAFSLGNHLNLFSLLSLIRALEKLRGKTNLRLSCSLGLINPVYLTGAISNPSYIEKYN